jgi:hypothetical protein
VGGLGHPAVLHALLVPLGPAQEEETVTFKEAIEKGACELGVTFCAERDFDWDRIMDEADQWRPFFERPGSRRSVLIGLRSTVCAAALSAINWTDKEREVYALLDACDAASREHTDDERCVLLEHWDALVMLHQILFLEAGVTFP